MSLSHSYEAIVLRTYDVGEADRFCILLTRERGRIPARASGARRIRSRFGTALLPMHRVRVEVREGSGGYVVTAAQGDGAEWIMENDLRAFVQAQEGIELLLALTEDAVPLPKIFDLCAAFLVRCQEEDILLSFTLRLLHLLGFLPLHCDDARYARLPPATKIQLQCCAAGALQPIIPPARRHLEDFRETLLMDLLAFPLRSPPIRMALHS